MDELRARADEALKLLKLQVIVVLMLVAFMVVAVATSVKTASQYRTLCAKETAEATQQLSKLKKEMQQLKTSLCGNTINR